MSISKKKGRKLLQTSMDKWKNDWNFINMTKRHRNYRDWRNIRDLYRDEVLEDQDGYPFDDFLNKRTAEAKPYVRPLINLRFKGHIFRRIYEDKKDEWNAASIP